MSNKFNVGDYVLFRAKTGKVWKLCQVRDPNTNRYNHKTKVVRMSLRNLKCQNPNGSFITAGEHWGDIIIPVPRDTELKDLNIETLVTLYAPKGTKIKDNLFFRQGGSSFNIQINSKNQSKMEELIKLAKDNGIHLRKEDTNNSNLKAKYVLLEDK